MNAPHTAGPWRWEFNREYKSVHLVGGVKRFDLTVMDFARWGTHGAVPRFRDTTEARMNLLDRLSDKPEWIEAFAGRGHHAHWCAAVIHPDARLMAASPTLLAAAQAAWNCIAELSPTQARVEVAQALQQAIESATGASL